MNFQPSVVLKCRSKPRNLIKLDELLVLGKFTETYVHRILSVSKFEGACSTL